jgi:hypothetical protein
MKTAISRAVEAVPTHRSAREGRANAWHYRGRRVADWFRGPDLRANVVEIPPPDVDDLRLALPALQPDRQTRLDKW